MTTSTRKFANDPDAVRSARRFALESLPDCSPDVREVVELLVSELAGNCVRHTDSGFEVRVSGDADKVRISVTDRGRGRPVVQGIDPTAVTGRGLALVQMLSSSWGVRYSRSAAGGKSVWFALELDGQRLRPQLVA